MKPTIEYLQSHFKKYNEQYFYSKLPMPTFELTKSIRLLGSYCPPTKKHGHLIRITEAYEGEDFFFQNTLIHEMIHYYLRFIGDEDKGRCRIHGENFKREAARINKDGWNIQRLASEEDMRRVRLVGSHPSFKLKTIRDVQLYVKHPMEEEELIYFVLKTTSNKDKPVILWLSYPTLQNIVYSELQEDDCTEEYRTQRIKAIEKAYKILIKFNYGNNYHLYVHHKDFSHFYRIIGKHKLAEVESNQAYKLKDSQPSSNYRIKSKEIHPISEWHNIYESAD